MYRLNKSPFKEAAADTRTEVKKIWLHHFGVRLMEGKELGFEEEGDEKKKIVRTDRHIDDLISAIYKEWEKLEKESRRPARSSGDKFKEKEVKFKNNMLKPFNIAKAKAEQIIEESGIIDWVEECQHLRNPLFSQT